MDPRELFGWNRDANRSAAARARETGEDINLTAWESFMGGNADHAANINKRKKQEDLNTQFGASAAEYGVSGADWGEGRETYLGRIQRGKKKEKDLDRKTNLKDQTTLLTATQRPEIAGIEAGLEQSRDANNLLLQQGKDQMTLMQEKMFNEARESRLDRAERADQRADDRLLQLEMYERADRKDEKNRRRESIQALVAGLSSLGAAFAV